MIRAKWFFEQVYVDWVKKPTLNSLEERANEDIVDYDYLGHNFYMRIGYENIVKMYDVRVYSGRSGILCTFSFAAPETRADLLTKFGDIIEFCEMF